MDFFIEQDKKSDIDFVFSFLSLISLVMLSGVLARIWFESQGDSLYKRILSSHLFCSWVACFIRILFAFVTSGITSNQAMAYFGYAMKIAELLFRNLGYGMHFAMFGMYFYILECSRKTRKVEAKRIEPFVYALSLFFLLVTSVQVAALDKFTFSRTYMLACSSANERYVHGLLMAVQILWILVASVSLALIIYFKRALNNLFQSTPNLARITIAYFRLWFSFAAFNLPYAICISLSAVGLMSVHARIVSHCLIWKALQGAVDCIIVYFLFLKRKVSQRNYSSDRFRGL
jgi:hypothetical protein